MGWVPTVDILQIGVVGHFLCSHLPVRQKHTELDVLLNNCSYGFVSVLALTFVSPNPNQGPGWDCPSLRKMGL